MRLRLRVPGVWLSGQADVLKARHRLDWLAVLLQRQPSHYDNHQCFTTSARYKPQPSSSLLGSGHDPALRDQFADGSNVGMQQRILGHERHVAADQLVDRAGAAPQPGLRS